MTKNKHFIIILVILSLWLFVRIFLNNSETSYADPKKAEYIIKNIIRKFGKIC